MRFWLTLIGLGVVWLGAIMIYYPWYWYLNHIALIALCGLWLLGQLVITRIPPDK